jgi:hypothetical protein
MNKNRMILAVSGGVIGLAVLAMAYFNWSAWSAKVAALEGDDEGEVGLESVQSQAQALSRKSVYPCAESVKAIETNAEKVDAWRTEAEKLASRGDRPVRKTTPAQFKADIAADAKRLAALPGQAGGHLMKPDFAFGPFRPFLAEGKMPTDAELPELTRRWEDVQLVVELLGACGVAELTDVAFKAEASQEPKVDARDAKKNRKNAKKNAAKKNAAAKAVAAAPASAPSSFSYVFTFATRAPAFVRAINALSTNDRFVVIDDFSFSRTADPVGEALGVSSRKDAANAAHSRRGRRGAPAPEEKKEDVSKNNVVTDPALDAPFAATLAVTVYDFRTMEEEKKAEEAAK